MSKKSKRESQSRRSSMKKARKASQTLLYQSRAAQGTNSLSKRSKLASKRKRAGALTTKKHAMALCDNAGCRNCHPEYFAVEGGCFYGTRFSRQPKPYQTSKQKMTYLNKKRAKQNNVQSLASD